MEEPLNEGDRRSSDSSNLTERTLDNHEMRIDRLEVEMARARGRLHEVEGDRATLRLLIVANGEQVKHLSTSLENFYGHAEDIAELAVEKVLVRRGEEKRRTRSYWLGWVSASVVLAGFVFNTVFLHFHF